MTGRYGYAHGLPTLAEAQVRALQFCRAPEAQDVVWAQNSWCALAVGDDISAFGYGYGKTPEGAQSVALFEC